MPPPMNAPSQFCTSFGTSMTTGPGRPVRAISNAVRTVASSFVGIGDEEDVLGDRAHDGGHRRFLERIRADGAAWAPGRR